MRFPNARGPLPCTVQDGRPHRFAHDALRGSNGPAGVCRRGCCTSSAAQAASDEIPVELVPYRDELEFAP